MPTGPRKVGRYTLDPEPLKKGGMGQVYRAVRDDGLVVAFKEVLAKFEGGSPVTERFRREVEALRRLPHHPHVIRYVDANADAAHPYLVMEFLAEGEDLSAYRASERLPFEDAAKLVAQAADGLQHLVTHDLVHRDITPRNLFWVPDGAAGVVKVIDLGLARLCRPGDDSFTHTGDRFGTPGYMAPEQWSDFKRTDVRADLFGLSATFYYLLTRTHPPRDLSAVCDFDQLNLPGLRGPAGGGSLVPPQGTAP